MGISSVGSIKIVGDPDSLFMNGCDIFKLPNGNLLILWDDQGSLSGNDENIKAKLYDVSTGNLGNEYIACAITADAITGGYSTDWSANQLTDGTINILTNVRGNIDTYWQVTLDAFGLALHPNTAIAEYTDSYEQRRVFQLSNGNTAIVSRSFDAVGPNTTVKLFNGNIPLPSEFSLSTPQYTELKLLPLDAGKMLLMHPASGGFVGQYIDADGNPTGPSFQLPLSTNKYHFVAQQLSDGTIAITTGLEHVETSRNLTTFVLDGFGDTTPTRQLLPIAQPLTTRTGIVFEMSDGLIVAESASPYVRGFSLYLPDGTPVGDRTDILSSADMSFLGPQVWVQQGTMRFIELDDGKFAVIGILRFKVATFLKIFDTKIFKGRSGADIWNGTLRDDSIYGNSGADVLAGNLGNDKLSGGDGDDVLTGGIGSDVLSGGKGADIASYAEEAKGVILALDSSIVSAGSAVGDTLISISGLVGSKTAADKLVGDALANTLSGLGGNDKIYGRAGNDELLGGDGDDIVFGETGDDKLAGGQGADTMHGNAGDDSLDGGDGADKLYGEDGDDIFVGGAGADTMYGGAGIDTVTYVNSKGGLLVDLRDFGAKPHGTGLAAGDSFSSIENLIGSKTGNDDLIGTNAVNVISGLGGHDRIRGMGGNDRLSGGDGDDLLYGGTGADKLNGGLGQDFAGYRFDGPVNASLDGSITATGAAVGDVYISIEDIGGSDAGADTLAGNADRNYIYGNSGADTLYGRGGSDILIGGKDGDALNGEDGFDYAYYLDDGAVHVSLDGSLTSTGVAAGDTFNSIEGIVGSSGGADWLAGDKHDNYLYGEGGNDQLFGRDGNDDLFGGRGKDLLNGGKGNDYYHFHLPSDRMDTIVNFEAGEKLVFTRENFKLNGVNTIETRHIHSSETNQALNSYTRFIFETDTRILWFDADGNGAKAAVAMVKLQNNYTLSNTDIELVS